MLPRGSRRIAVALLLRRRPSLPESQIETDEDHVRFSGGDVGAGAVRHLGSRLRLSRLRRPALSPAGRQLEGQPLGAMAAGGGREWLICPCMRGPSSYAAESPAAALPTTSH